MDEIDVHVMIGQRSTTLSLSLLLSFIFVGILSSLSSSLLSFGVKDPFPPHVLPPMLSSFLVVPKLSGHCHSLHYDYDFVEYPAARARCCVLSTGALETVAFAS